MEAKQQDATTFDEIVKVREICDTAALGDVDSLDYLNLNKDMKIRTWCLSQDKTDEVREEIEQGIDDCVYHIEAASRLGMKHFANVCKLNLALLHKVFKQTFDEHPTVPHHLDPKVVAKTMSDQWKNSRTCNTACHTSL